MDDKEVLPFKTLADMLQSKDILEEILLLPKEALYQAIPELENLDYSLTGNKITSHHKFTVLEHTLKILRNFFHILRVMNNPEQAFRDLSTAGNAKKTFYNRVINLLNELDLKFEAEDYKVLVLAILLHDIGKGSMDKSMEDLEEEVNQRSDNLTLKDLHIYYKQVAHEERGAHLSFSILDEIQDMSFTFAIRVKNLILNHGDFSKLYRKDKDFDFFHLLRRIVDSASTYNFPLSKKDKKENIVLKELNLNYLLFLLDIYGVDDTGNFWYKQFAVHEANYQKARWLLVQKPIEAPIIIDQVLPEMDPETRSKIIYLIYRITFQNFRYNDRDLTFLENKLKFYEDNKVINKITHTLKNYFDHIQCMPVLYLTNTTANEKKTHLDLIHQCSNSFEFEIKAHKDLMKILIASDQAPAGSLIKIVQAILMADLHLDRKLKIHDLHAYSGDDGRLIDFYTLQHIDNQEVTSQALEHFRKYLYAINQQKGEPKIEPIPIQIPLQDMLSSIMVKQEEVLEGDEELIKITVSNKAKLNYILLISLYSLYPLNIVNAIVKDSDQETHYHFFLKKSMLRFNMISMRDFRETLTENLKRFYLSLEE